ncbi:MAG: hypothetical protein KGL40_13695 [Rhodocyclaceae bacterium]|nr:hypothetical protein [Rhodocyclaceae bacterium]
MSPVEQQLLISALVAGTMAIAAFVLVPNLRRSLAQRFFYAGFLGLTVSFVICAVIDRSIMDELLVDRSIPRFSLAMLFGACVLWALTKLAGNKGE